MRTEFPFRRRHRLVLIASVAAIGAALGGLASWPDRAPAVPTARSVQSLDPAPALLAATRPAAPVGARPLGPAAATRPTSATTDGASPSAVVGPVLKPTAVSTAARRPATSTAATPVTAAVRSNPSAATTTTAYAGKWGLYTPDFPGTLVTVDSLQSAVHRTATYVMWYVHWAGPYSGLNLSDLAAVKANGSTPLITWMSDDPTGLTTITDSDVASGRYDRYIRSWAQGLRSFRKPVLLRFDHEMNGNWSGWSPGVNGNTAASYIAAWRHVYSVFSSMGASNVSFVWSPNVDYTGATPMSSVYPGNPYVGLVGLDGYNWGTVGGHVWQTPQQVFGPSVAEVTAITSRPFMITEVGSTSSGGDKPGWIGQFFQYLRSTPAIQGFVWFDANKETDWAIGSVSGSLSAFVAGMAG